MIEWMVVNMNYTPDEIMQYISEEDVKFIRLAFCDVFGRQKNISIMPTELARAFEMGIAIDSSAIPGFSDEADSDLLLIPDPSKIAVYPWRPDHGRVVRMFTTITRPDGSVYPGDTRALLKKTVEDAERKGYSFSFGPELEFYLFKLDENGEPTKIPYDHAGYMDIAPEDKGENVRREICLTLEQMGIRPECSHHEEGPGQNEIDFRYADPLTAADNTITFKTVVRTIAARSGLYADFSAKPIEDAPGNGMHMNISAKNAGGEDIMPSVIAGILERIKEMTVFLNPTANSYKRFGTDKAPKYISWSRRNRSQLIRIPAAAGEYRRAELRSPDPMCNPYLAMALIINAGIEGVERGLKLGEPSMINMFSASEALKTDYDILPKSLKSAADKALGSELIKRCLPEEIIRGYCG